MIKELTLALCSSWAFAAHIYAAPSEDSEVISEIEKDHEYVIKTQDWVQVTDRSTNQKGWAKLSDMKQTLSENYQWSYQWHSSDLGAQQAMYYKPFDPKEVNVHIRKVHQQHKKIMSDFQAFWDELDLIEENLDQA